MKTFYLLPAFFLLIGGILYYVIEQNSKKRFLNSKWFNLICVSAMFFNVMGSVLCFIELLHG
ncbi:hypothetical protein BUE76_00190 [Cnuella takakiae]|nr:hypothetical protein BUE76_00190 [Cnuella takakiae]